MTAVLPLLVHGLTPADMPYLIAAKQALDLPFKVIPTLAAAGCHGRVLALREDPDFLCDSATVRDVANSVALIAAMRWVLDETVSDVRASLILDKMTAIFPGIKEVTDELQ